MSKLFKLSLLNTRGRCFRPIFECLKISMGFTMLPSPVQHPVYTEDIYFLVTNTGKVFYLFNLRETIDFFSYAQKCIGTVNNLHFDRLLLPRYTINYQRTCSTPMSRQLSYSFCSAPLIVQTVDSVTVVSSCHRSKYYAYFLLWHSMVNYYGGITRRLNVLGTLRLVFQMQD